MAKPEVQQRLYVRLQFLQAPFPAGPNYVAPLRIHGEPVVGRSMVLVFDGSPDAKGFVNATASVTGPEAWRALQRKKKRFVLQANETDIIALGTVLKMVISQQTVPGTGTRFDLLPKGDEVVDGLSDMPVFKQRHPPEFERNLRGSKEPAHTELPVKHGWSSPVRYEGYKADPNGQAPPKWNPKLK